MALFFCLWAVRARSVRASALTEPWAMPPTAGTMKIERGGCASTSRHNSASRCAPLVRLVVVFPSASASPSCCASAWSLGLRYLLRLNLLSVNVHSVLDCSVVCSAEQIHCVLRQNKHVYCVIVVWYRFLLNGPHSLSIVGVINDGLMNRVHSFSICFFDQ